MKKIILTAILILCIAALAVAASFATITVSTASVALTTSFSAYSPSKCWITTAGGNVRVRLDGTAPTASVGHMLPDATQLLLETRDEVEGFRAIRADASDVTVSATCW